MNFNQFTLTINLEIGGHLLRMQNNIPLIRNYSMKF